MNTIVEYYENYKEENRLSTNNARKIEFITTTHMIDSIIEKNSIVLDCAAGTGIYAFYLADKGHKVTATDITPRHIEYIRKQLKDKLYDMDTDVLDACDMSCFHDESFDVVLNMGPFYHLTDKQKRLKCLKESIRVLKQGGILITAYIPRLYLNQMITMSDRQYLDKKLLSQIRDVGILKHDNPKCFWTDTYYSSYDEMEELYQNYSIETLVHFAQDGVLPMMGEKVDKWSDEEFKIWKDYHLSVCKEKSIIGMSNHVTIVGEKK